MQWQNTREKVCVCIFGWVGVGVTGGSTVEMEWGGGSGCGVTGEVEKDREAVAPLFFKWKSYSVIVYDQFPGASTPEFTHPLSHTETHMHTN